MTHLHLGKISQTGNLLEDLFVTACSLSYSLWHPGNIRILSKVSRETRKSLLPLYLNDLKEYSTISEDRRYYKRVRGTLLYEAIKNKDIRHMKELIDSGININQPFFYKEFTELNRLDITYIHMLPIHYAIVECFVEGVELLLSHSPIYCMKYYYDRDYDYGRIAYCDEYDHLTLLKNKLSYTKNLEEKVALEKIQELFDNSK